MRSITRRLVAGVALCAAVVVTGTTTYHGAAQDSVSLTAEIHAGFCSNPDKEIAYDLGDVALMTGTGVRSLPSITTATVSAGVETLTGSPHAILLTRGAGKVASRVACGEINDVTNADGSIAVGLREANGSTYAGIALLRANGAQTAVDLYVANGLTGVAGVEANGQPTRVDDVITVTVSDGTIAADQVDIQKGSVVQFVVYNDGSEPHEVMLEKEGEIEHPLDEDGVQAETEDFGPGKDASFIYTFTKGGDYQLACHIGNHAYTGELLVLHVK